MTTLKRAMRTPASDVGAGRISQLVGVAVDLDDVAEGVLAIDHAIGLLSWIVVADLSHALAPAMLLDELDATLEVGVLDAEVEQAGTPVLEGAALGLGARELEELEAGAVGRGEMGDAERAPALAEDVVAHLADGAVVVVHRGRPHDDVKAERLRIEFYGLVEVGDGEADMAEADGGGHGA